MQHWPGKRAPAPEDRRARLTSARTRPLARCFHRGESTRRTRAGSAASARASRCPLPTPPRVLPVEEGDLIGPAVALLPSRELLDVDVAFHVNRELRLAAVIDHDIRPAAEVPAVESPTPDCVPARLRPPARAGSCRAASPRPLASGARASGEVRCLPARIRVSGVRVPPPASLKAWKSRLFRDYHRGSGFPQGFPCEARTGHRRAS
jgi:hypothetical protein